MGRALALALVGSLALNGFLAFPLVAGSGARPGHGVGTRPTGAPPDIAPRHLPGSGAVGAHGGHARPGDATLDREIIDVAARLAALGPLDAVGEALHGPWSVRERLRRVGRLEDAEREVAAGRLAATWAKDEQCVGEILAAMREGPDAPALAALARVLWLGQGWRFPAGTFTECLALVAGSEPAERRLAAAAALARIRERDGHTPAALASRVAELVRREPDGRVSAQLASAFGELATGAPELADAFLHAALPLPAGQSRQTLVAWVVSAAVGSTGWPGRAYDVWTAAPPDVREEIAVALSWYASLARGPTFPPDPWPPDAEAASGRRRAFLDVYGGVRDPGVRLRLLAAGVEWLGLVADDDAEGRARFLHRLAEREPRSDLRARMTRLAALVPRGPLTEDPEAFGLLHDVLEDR